MSYEQRVAALKEEGMTAAEARRIALAEQRVLKHAEAEEGRKNARRNQANVRIGVSIAKGIAGLFKGR